MQPVAGHPYVLAQAVPDGYGATDLTCQCRFCGDVWRYHCQYPPKLGSWVAQYAARHHHEVPGLRERFATQYHLSLHQLRQQQRTGR